MTTENYSISVFNNKKNDMHGIFALLHDINGHYASRYKIEDENSRPNGEAYNLDKYYEGEGYWLQTNENVFSFNITFDSPFLLAGYSLCNQIHQAANSFPSSWNIYGEINGHRYKLDTRHDVSFCEEGKNVCSEENIRTFDTINVYRSQKAVNRIIFEQTANSVNKPYVYMRALDLYGTLCGKDQFCSFIHYTCEYKKRYLKPVLLWISIFTMK